MYEEQIKEAHTDEDKERVNENFVRYRKNLLQKKKLSSTLESIRSDIIYRKSIEDLTREKMYREHKDRLGLAEDDKTTELKTEIEATDEVSQKWLEFKDKFLYKYYDAKWNWYESVKVKGLLKGDGTIPAFIDDQKEIEGNLKERVEFMYNNLDDFNDRKFVRDQLTAKIHEKSSIQDIGEVLDDLIREYEANYEYEGTLQPESLTKEYSTTDLYPQLEELTESRRIMPSIFENRKYIGQMTDLREQKKYNDLIEEVEKEDYLRDHSRKSLSSHEELELEIYSAVKRDPYYKHYIYNCLRYESEFINSRINDLSMAIAADNYKMRIKFDPIQIPQLEVTSSSHGFIGRLSQGKAWGAGRRKTARAIAAIQPGSGVITVNGKKLGDYFLIPQQRRDILKPIRIANYTSVLDIELWVKGGGVSGQSQACIPAIAKALSRFDPEVRQLMEASRVVYSDGRMRERKHYGKKRARKGRVYRRR